MERPQWLIDYCTRVREALQLQAWEITYLMDDRPIPDRPECGAACYTTYSYWSARIEFRPSDFLEPSLKGKLAVIHEHLHISLAEMTHAVEQGANSFIPKQRQRLQFLNHIYSDAEERCLVRLERAIYEMLESAQAAQAEPQESADEHTATT